MDDMEKRCIRTSDNINSRASTDVRAVCQGKDAAAAIAVLANALQMENRRRRHRGDLPIAYELSCSSRRDSTTSAAEGQEKGA